MQQNDSLADGYLAVLLERWEQPLNGWLGADPAEPGAVPDRVLALVAGLGACLAVGETVILLHPVLPLVGVSIGMKRGCQQNDRTLADGYACLLALEQAGRRHVRVHPGAPERILPGFEHPCPLGRADARGVVVELLVEERVRPAQPEVPSHPWCHVAGGSLGAPLTICSPGGPPVSEEPQLRTQLGGVLRSAHRWAGWCPRPSAEISASQRTWGPAVPASRSLRRRRRCVAAVPASLAVSPG